MNQRRAHNCILASVGFCTAIALTSLLSSLQLFLFEFQIVLSTLNAFLLSAVMLIYIQGYCHLRNSVDDFGTIASSRVKKFVTASFSMIVLSYVPITVTIPLYSYHRYEIDSDSANIMASLVTTATVLVLITSTLNPIVVMKSCRELRTFIKGKLRGLVCKASTSTVEDLRYC